MSASDPKRTSSPNSSIDAGVAVVRPFLRTVDRIEPLARFRRSVRRLEKSGYIELPGLAIFVSKRGCYIGDVADGRRNAELIRTDFSDQKIYEPIYKFSVC